MSELAGKKIFVVEDESDIAELVKVNMSLEGALVTCFPRGEDAVNALNSEIPDLLLLDLMLPGVSGLDICKWVRANKKLETLPIVMLTAKSSDEDIVCGIDLGADDYVTKPFSPKVLIAKVKAVLKRSATEVASPEDILEKHGISIHPGRHEVKISGVEIELRNVEFKILHFLMQRPGWVFTRAQLVDAIHGENYAVTDRSIDFQMVGLRKKLGDAGQYIETVRGVGYRFTD